MLPINKQSAEYTKYAPVFTRCDDAIEGQDAIKSKTTTYLPMLPGMFETQYGKQLYDIYIQNALWDPFSGRSYRAYLGMITRKPASKNLAGVEFADVDFTSDGLSVDQVARELSGIVIKNFGGGILIDQPAISTEGQSVATVEAMDIRPYGILYSNKQVINYSYKSKGGLSILTEIILEDYVPIHGLPVDPESAMVVSDKATIRRHLYLDVDGLYTVQTYYKTKNVNADSDWMEIPGTKAEPIIRGRRLDYIPFVPCSEAGKKVCFDYPLINDVVNINLADYRNEALYRDALLFNGRPTPCVSGLILAEGQKKVSLGSSTILQFESGGQWGMLGGGADVSALKDSAAELKRRGAAIGSRALGSDPNGVESAETAAIHRAGEMGILSNVSSAVSESITAALVIIGEWVGLSPEQTSELSYSLSTDYLPYNIDAQLLNTIWQMYVRGDVSYSTFYHNLTRGEITIDGWTEDDEKESMMADRESRPDLQVNKELFGFMETPQDTTGATETGAVGESTNVVTLNGAQVQAATGIVKSVVAGEIPRDSGLAQLKNLFNLTDQVASELLGKAGL